MQKPIGIVLAAGRGTRMRSLTDSTPKPLLEVRGEPILIHVLRGLAPEVSKLVIVIGYLGEHIQERVGSVFEGVPVSYAIQQNPKGGTLDALRVGLQEDFAADASGFIVVSADDIHLDSTFKHLGQQAKEKPGDMMLVGVRVEDTERLKRFGVFVFSPEGRIIGIEEKPLVPPSFSINCGLYYFPKKFTDIVFSDIPTSSSGELYLTDAVDVWIGQGGADYFEADHMESIGTPEDLKVANGEIS